ncbi:MAG: exo-alpha-sialidase [Anaerolineaceae bacterium]|nr:exo-alpha-sialidase [Anaerolineaceae bacterium]
MIRQKFLILFVALLGVLLWTFDAEAQIQPGWSPPYQLSASGTKASEASVIADSYGYVHAFWTEDLADGTTSVLQYSRYDGWIWSTPIDIQIGSVVNPIKGISPFVDDNGRLHLVWTTGQSSPIRYTSAPAHSALSAQAWETPTLIPVAADRSKIVVDSQGVIHVIFTNLNGSERGVFAVRSKDQGRTWSLPTWIDPDVPAEQGPGTLQVQLDDAGGIHVVWFYISLVAVSGDWVRYAHSLDGGQTWSRPFTIDKVGEEGGSLQLDAASPVMAVTGQTVHVVWAGSEVNHLRNHRYSTDAGLTWSEPTRIFGSLNGQAFEALAADGAGRIHYFGQIRYPQGIYHSIWDGEEWTEPELIYLISSNSTDPIGNRIHAHHTHPAILAGNQVVLTFADSPPEPERRLFVTIHTLTDIPQSHLMSTPTPTPIPTLAPEAGYDITEAVAGPTPLPVDLQGGPLATDTNDPGKVLWYGFAASLLLISGFVVFRFIRVIR